MQDKLSREDFVLERFPDELLHELEKKELKEELEKAKEETKKTKEEVKKTKEETKKLKEEIIIKLLNKGMGKAEIADLLDCNIDQVNIYNSKSKE